MTAPYWVSDFWLVGVLQALAFMNLVDWAVRAYAAKRRFGIWHALTLAAVIVAPIEAWRRVGLPTAGYLILGGLTGIAWALWKIRRGSQDVGLPSKR